MSRDDTPRQPDARTVDRRSVVVGLGFLDAAGIAKARQPTERINYLGNRKLDQIIPKKIGGWSFETTSGLIVPTEDQLSNLLYSDLLTRVYTNGDQPPIMLLVAQSGSQTGILQIHRPETCYAAGGFQLSAMEPHDIDLGGRVLRTNMMQAVSDQRAEQMIYWTRIGTHLPSTWARQRWAVAEDNLEKKIPDAVLVRISTIGLDRGVAEQSIGTFTRTMLEAMPPSDRRVLVGPLAV